MDITGQQTHRKRARERTRESYRIAGLALCAATGGHDDVYIRVADDLRARTGHKRGRARAPSTFRSGAHRERQKIAPARKKSSRTYKFAGPSKFLASKGEASRCSSAAPAA